MRSVRLILLVAGAVVLGACTNPMREAQLIAEITAMGDAVNDAKSYLYELEMRIDSLKTIIARHDTAVVRLAEFTGVQIPRAPY